MRPFSAPSYLAGVIAAASLACAAPSSTVEARGQTYSINTDPEVWRADEVAQSCGTSSFHGGAGGPKVKDCECIAYAISHTGGGWEIGPDLTGNFQVSSCGTCVFTIGTANILEAFVGHGDMVDVIHDSISRFGKDGHVAANGHMGCGAGSFDGTAGVDWWLAHA